MEAIGKPWRHPGWFLAFGSVTGPSASSDEPAFVRRIVIIALVLLGVAAVLWLAFRLSTVIFMVFVSLFVTVAFEPPVHFLAKRGWRRGAATGVVFGAAFVLVVLFFWALVPLFVEQVQRLIAETPDIVESFLLFLRDTLGFDISELDIDEVGRNLLGSVEDFGGAVAGGVVGIASSLFAFLIFATTVALFSFYMIAELPKLQRTVLSFMPESQQRRALRVWEVAVEKMGGYIYSRLILAVVSATITYLFLTALDVPFAISLAIWVGTLSQFVPVVGTYLASIFPGLVALSFNGGPTAIWVIVFFVGYQQLENYLISPRITERTMEIHPAISVAAIIIGATLMGGIGVILALPMAGIIEAIISETRKSYDVVLDRQEPASGT